MNLSTEILAHIIGANNRSARQRAWKLGSVVDTLRSDGVSPDDFPREIRRRGGIEKIYRSSVNYRHPNVSKVDSRSLVPVSDLKDEAAVTTGLGGGKTNNKEVLVGVYMKLADHDALLDLPSGARIRLSAVKIGQEKAKFQIRKSKILKS